MRLRLLFHVSSEGAASNQSTVNLRVKSRGAPQITLVIDICIVLLPPLLYTIRKLFVSVKTTEVRNEAEGGEEVSHSLENETCLSVVFCVYTRVVVQRVNR